MKLELMAHQRAAREKAGDRRVFAYLCEQGTGKTIILLDEAEDYWRREMIEGLLVVAPKGVHTNWVLREIPKCLSVPHRAAAYLSGSAPAARQIETLYVERRKRELKILTLNVDAVNTSKGHQAALRFLKAFRAMMVVDESGRIKNPEAGRSKKIVRLGAAAVCRRIATGTPLTNAPLDLFGQFLFLDPRILRCRSHRVFIATYAELLPRENRLVQHILEKTRGRGNPQVIAKDHEGKPRWKNLEQLSELIRPHSFRITKKECLDLPEKVYTTRFFELSPAMRKAYRALEKNEPLIIDGDEIPFSKIATLAKRRQITSGFILHEGEALEVIEEDSRRLKLLSEIVEDIDGQFIIWAYYTEELRRIAELLKKMDVSFVEYRGEISNSKRELAVDSFQAGDARAFLGQPGAGGVGLTLTAAETVVYYSNDYNADTRMQSEDRAHRIGTHNPVLYIDIVARGTLDEDIARIFQNKVWLADEVLEDSKRQALLSEADRR